MRGPNAECGLVVTGGTYEPCRDKGSELRGGEGERGGGGLRWLAN